MRGRECTPFERQTKATPPPGGRRYRARVRALVLERPAPAAEGPLRLEELPNPEPAPGELVLELAACAVCRTDLQLCEGDLPAHRLPVVPGHQAVGRVAAIGEGVDGWEL